jgi:hypothetical protein
MISEKEKALYRKEVLRAHNIKLEGTMFWCNDGDGFDNVWEALEHTIWLDLMASDAKDYHDLIYERVEKFKDVHKSSIVKK